MTEMSVLIRMSVGINEGTKRVKGYQTETARRKELKKTKHTIICFFTHPIVHLHTCRRTYRLKNSEIVIFFKIISSPLFRCFAHHSSSLIT